MTNPANSALHMMEGQGASQPVAFALKWPDDERLNLSTVFDTEEEANNYMEQCSDGVVVVPLFAAPKTSFAHWVDEVEASGEAEKHAYPPMPEPTGWASLNVLTNKNRYEKLPVQSLQPGLYSHTQLFDEGQMTAYVDADREMASLELHALKTDVRYLKALYEKSQELFARERGITKEQGEHIKELAAALAELERAVDMHLGRSGWTQTQHLKGLGYSGAVREALYAAHDIARAALSKVQHVAARGAEVSE